MCANMSNDIIETIASDSASHIQSFIKHAVTINTLSTTTQGLQLKTVLQPIADDPS